MWRGLIFNNTHNFVYSTYTYYILYIRSCIYIYIIIYNYINTYMHTYICTCIHTRVHVHACTSCIVHISRESFSKIFNQPILALKARYPTCNLCIHLMTDFMANSYIHTYIHTYTCTHSHTHTHI